jgi:hypothetical protein
MNSKSSSQSGVALIIVLGFLVIITGLAVAFFSSVTTELQGSRNFASGVTTRQLADSTVGVVMGQIREATSLPNAAWASQPGMIRTYRDGNSISSKADQFFKLYSSDKMVISNADVGKVLQDDFQDDLDADFDNKPALWTDLNAPVLVQDPAHPTDPNATVPRFPIIDPRAWAVSANVNDPYTITPPVGTAVTDPRYLNMEGFWYDVAGKRVNGLVGPGSTSPSDKQRVPMPTRWIYVLQDGTLTTPDAGSGMLAKWSGGADSKKPSKANPIVGRVAFWTDDETSKVNLNTAGGYSDINLPTGYDMSSGNFAGSYWDTPRFYTEFDRGMPYPESNGQNTGQQAGTPLPGKGGLAICQLLQGEFQRYPGHPGTTSLGLLFRSQLTSEQLYEILPRFGRTNSQHTDPGSTQGGTKRVIPDNPVANEFTANPKPDDFQIQPKMERLYSSVDELLFAANVAKTDPTMTSSKFLRRTTDTALKDQFQTDLKTPAITPELLDKMRFFITAQSRAPELNLFGRPRVTVWPVRAETATESSGLNAYDNLILFCSTIGPAGGGRPDTTTTPANSGLYRYIFTRRELPAAVQSSKSGQWELPTSYLRDADRPRNKQIIEYLRKLTESKFPGFGGVSLTDKLGVDNRNTLLAEIFDYILCANSKDTTTKTIDGSSTAKPFAPNGIAMPAKIDYLKAGTSYKGFGRFPTINEASLVFYYAGPQMTTVATKEEADATGVAIGKPIVDVDQGSDPMAADKMFKGTGRPKGSRMGCFLLLSTFNPMQGYSPISDPSDAGAKISFEIEGLGDLAVTYSSAAAVISTPLGFLSKDPYDSSLPLSNTMYVGSNSTWGGRNLGGFEGFMHTLVGTGSINRPYKIKATHKGLTLLDDTYRTGPGTTRVVNYPHSEALQLPDSWDASSATDAPKDPDDVLNSGGSKNQEWYQFQSTKLIPIPTNPDPNIATTFNLAGADIKVTIKYGGLEVQKIKMQFPGTSQGWPVPRGDPTMNPAGKWNKIDLRYITKPGWPAVAATMRIPVTDKGKVYDWIDLRDVNKWMGVGHGSPLGNKSPTDTGSAPTPILAAQANEWLTAMKSCYWTDNGSFYPDYVRANRLPGLWASKSNNSHLQTTLQASWSFASRLAWAQQQSYDNYKNPYNGPTLNNYGNRLRQILQPGDTIRSLVYCDANNGSVKGGKSGDLRILALNHGGTDGAEGFEKHPDYMDLNLSRACALRRADGVMYFAPGAAAKEGGSPSWRAKPTDPIDFSANGNPGVTLAGALGEAPFGNHVLLGGTNKFPVNRAVGNLVNKVSNTNPTINGVLRDDAVASTGQNVRTGDFDTGVGTFPDGPYGNKQDEGNVIYAWQDIYKQWHYPVPYYSDTWQYQKPGNTFTSPSRQMPSPVMMGSLPRRAYSDKSNTGKGWETLCFTPAPAGPNHPGNVDPKDHLLLDLFQMPVVEPYPISEPFSTAGKVNLNYQIAPFSYITRSTALRAALHPLRVTAGLLANTYFYQYKSGVYSGSYPNGSYPTGAANTYDAANSQPLPTNPRKPVDRDKTIKAIDEFFKAGQTDPSKGFFKSASQICERFMYPTGTSVTDDASMLTYWSSFGGLFGDNVREKTYTDLYNRITTKSNTYCVHMKVQTLRQLPRTDYTTWDENKDKILGEYRGATTIERYIDPADPRFNSTNANFVNPDDTTSATNLETLYRFRTVVNKRFAP